MIERIGIYPGTFDPVTNGHMDVIKDALKICDKLIIGVAEDTAKTPIFSIEERVELVQNDVDSLDVKDRAITMSFSGLLVDFAKSQNASILVRGLRAVSDFEYEFQLSAMNNRLSPDIQTIFIPASGTNQFLASKLVKEVARLDGDISSFVSRSVAKKLKEYYSV